MCIIPSGCLDHARLHFRAELDPPLHLENENKVVFLFPSAEQRNRGVADSPQVAAPPGMPAQISDPLRNIQVDTHGVSKIAKKLAIRRLAAHFPAGSELD